MRRLAAVLGAAAALILAGASPAHAHAVGGAQATNYRSDITGVSPPAPGVTVRLLDLGQRVEMVNRTTTDVTVLGYHGEPYLRAGPSGVFENRNAPTLYENQSRSSDPSAILRLPAGASPTAAPEWHRRSGGQSVTWSDHRTRWEGADPPGVKAHPGQAQVVVARWMVPLLVGEEPVTVTGRISWIPGPAAFPWFLAAIALFALTFGAAFVRWWPQVLSGALALLIAVDAVRLFGAATFGGGSLVGNLLNGVLVGVLEVMAWGAGAWAVGAIQQRRPAGLYAAMAIGLVLGFVSGVGDLLYLAYSQLPSALPDAAARSAVAVCLGIGFGLVGSAFLALRSLGALPQVTETAGA